jgi:hypothetical protein
VRVSLVRGVQYRLGVQIEICCVLRPGTPANSEHKCGCSKVHVGHEAVLMRFLLKLAGEFALRGIGHLCGMVRPPRNLLVTYALLCAKPTKLIYCYHASISFHSEQSIIRLQAAIAANAKQGRIPVKLQLR